MRSVLYRAFKILIAAMLVLVFRINSGYPTHLRTLTNKELIRNADSIVVGQVVEKYSEWSKNGKFIVTCVKLKVLEDVKGSEGGAGELIIKEVGGSVGNREMIVHGSPQFNVGEKALLFLRRGLRKHKNVLGLSLGKFRIIKDQLTGEEVAINPAQRRTRYLMKRDDGSVVEDEKAKQGQKIILRELINEIKEELEGSNGPDQ